MRIVTCAAPHLVSGRLFAAARVHAFDMTCAPKRGPFRIVVDEIRYVLIKEPELSETVPVMAAIALRKSAQSA